jgi:hypothetical protein
MATETLPDLDPRAEPVDRKIFGKATDLERGVDVSETIERGVA